MKARRADLVIVVPMLGRPHRVAPLLDSIRATTAGARVLFALSPGDEAVRLAVERAGEEHITVERLAVGDYARKINAGYRASTEPHIFCAADDLEFQPGWYEAACRHIDPGITGVVGTNDLGSPRVMAGLHSTHSLVTRDYADTWGTIDQPGLILHEGYVHEWVDDELVETARARGVWAFAHDAHVRHRHPCWDPSVPMDSMYRQQGRRMALSKPHYLARRALWT